MKSLIKKIVPKRFHWQLHNSYRGALGWSSKAYSSLGEDLVIAQLMKHKKNGFYVDVGAFHPKKYSNTQYLREYYQWRGVNIEPNPENFPLFETERPEDININCGVAKEAGTLNYYQFVDPLYNTFSESRMHELDDEGMKAIKVKNIPVETLTHLLEHKHITTPIDLLNVDVENFDLQVLESLDWNRYSPNVVCVEDHQMDIEVPKNSDIYRFLQSNGYKLVSQCFFTSLYKKIAI